jgi:membrane fusion protein (multidrug efflux system)
MSSIKDDVRILVPQAAVSESRDGSFVYVVGEDGKAEMRIIKKRSVRGTDWIVDEGLEAGETVIVQGIQKVRSGQEVKVSVGNQGAGSRAGGK